MAGADGSEIVVHMLCARAVLRVRVPSQSDAQINMHSESVHLVAKGYGLGGEWDKTEMREHGGRAHVGRLQSFLPK